MYFSILTSDHIEHNHLALVSISTFTRDDDDDDDGDDDGDDDDGDDDDGDDDSDDGDDDDGETVQGLARNGKYQRKINYVTNN